ncbi:NAD-dependent epimerase/dehydratase family protein [Tropicibacter sp. S64]|uniref:NAD-dependent epimerase/dehydratase family protein n=1 Tax=Tropicibacter sp. S64 TaxID=3415122 RepID=UPI003C7B3DD6
MTAPRVDAPACAVLGTGQIGTFAIRALVEAGWQVTAADKAPAASFVRRYGQFDGRLAALDVTDARTVRDFFADSGPHDAVIFAAGLTGHKAIADPDTARHIAVQGVRTVGAEMIARGIPRLVAVSSLAVYDTPNAGIKAIPESAPTAGPIGPYGSVIRAMEAALQDLGQSDALAIRILRTAGVFGPNRFDHGSHSSQLVEHLLYGAMQGMPIRLQGDWEDCDDMIYARDVGRALAAAAALETPGLEIINVGTARTTSLRDLVRTIESVAGRADVTLEPRHAPSRPITRPPLQVSRMAQVLGPTRYDLDAAIRDFARETNLIAAEAEGASS